jgi:hypothetical protein
MGCTYVKEFDFGTKGKDGSVKYCGGGAVKKYADGGSVKADMKQDKAMVKAAVHKHEKAMHKGEPLTKLAKGGKVPEVRSMAKREMMATPTMEKREVVRRESVRAPAAPEGMIRDNSKLGIRGNKNPGIARKSVPVAPNQPMLALKKGGAVSQAKVGKVMGEFKSGDLHSGKNGPVVKSPKQAIAIALSEGRKAAKR